MHLNFYHHICILIWSLTFLESYSIVSGPLINARDPYIASCKIKKYLDDVGIAFDWLSTGPGNATFVFPHAP